VSANDAFIKRLIRLMIMASGEVNEETAWQFNPEFITSIQLWRKNPDSPSFLRVCFVGTCHDHQPDQSLDEGIISSHWLTRKEIVARKYAIPFSVSSSTNRN
jgi:hypothetical protein